MIESRGKKDQTLPEPDWEEVTQLSYLGPTIILSPPSCMFIFLEAGRSQAKDRRYMSTAAPSCGVGCAFDFNSQHGQKSQSRN